MPDRETVLRLRRQGRWLAIGHYLGSGLVALFSLFPMVYVGIGAFIVFAPGTSNPPPVPLGVVFSAFGIVFTLVVLAFAVATAVPGLLIRAETGRVALFALAIVEMVHQPVGITLGLLTILWLVQPGCEALFAMEADAPDPG